MTSINKFSLDPRNANLGTDKGRKALAKSLALYGAGRSILVDKKGRVIAGNKTLEQAIASGHKDVLVVKTDGKKLVAVQRMDLDLKDKRAKALALADNRVAELDLSWNSEVLAELGKDIDLGEFWSADELEELLGENGNGSEAPEPQLDKAAELQKKWKTKLGQLWLVGEHRLLCGDAGLPADVSALMGDDAAQVVFTSPPYAQQRKYGGTKFDWDALMKSVFSCLPTSNDSQVLVNLGLVHRDCEWIPYWDGWLELMRGFGWRRFGFYVWDQGSGLPGDWNGRLAPSHEFIFHFNRQSCTPTKSVKCKRAGDHTKPTGLRRTDGSISGWSHGDAAVQDFKVPDSVLRITREMARSGAEAEHPARFPAQLPELILQTWPGDVYDPFLGSGTTMVAAQQLSRRCYGMEIEPKYIAVILERLSQMGLTPKLSS